MPDRVLVAGASGAIGRALLPMLTAEGFEVFGTTRRAERAMQIETARATPVIVDVFDADALAAAFERIRPIAVIHQLTDLPPALDPARMAAATQANARIRDEGTRNLCAAARAVKVKRLVAQSIAWAYRAGDPQPYMETLPLDSDADGARRTSVGGVLSLEAQVLGGPWIGTVLRYGQLYGPHTGSDAPKGPSPLHVDDAARAALVALQRSNGGVFNIAAPNPAVSTEKARRELGWDAIALKRKT